jgi:hypothetical protein
MRHVLDVSDAADAIVFTGYYHKPENAAYLRAQGVGLPYDVADFHRRKTMPAELDTRVVEAWRASAITTPLFRKTSCGVSFAHDLPDYNGRWGVRELCSICPVAQQDLCAANHRAPSATEFEQILNGLGYNSPYLIDAERGHVWTHGLGEQRRYPIQHALGYQIWELDQPHYLHAHGRSLTGHAPPGKSKNTSRRYASGSPPHHALMKTTDPRPQSERRAAMAKGPSTLWTEAPLVAIDLEGTGAQNLDEEAILEIALVPITAGRPSLDNAYTTLINPGRPIPRRPWISPGLTDTTLATAPPLSDLLPAMLEEPATPPGRPEVCAHDSTKERPRR